MTSEVRLLEEWEKDETNDGNTQVGCRSNSGIIVSLVLIIQGNGSVSK